LTRNAQNQYILRYEDPSKPGEKTILQSPASLEALLAEMRRSPDFKSEQWISGQNDYDVVRAQAALIPAVVRPAEVDRAKKALVDFYTTPNNSTFRELARIRDSYSIPAFRYAFTGSIYALSPELSARVAKG
jgi:hypothetical protein